MNVFKERAEDASYAYKFILSRHAKYRRCGGGALSPPFRSGGSIGGSYIGLAGALPLRDKSQQPSGRRGTLLDLAAFFVSSSSTDG